MLLISAKLGGREEYLESERPGISGIMDSFLWGEEGRRGEPPGAGEGTSSFPSTFPIYPGSLEIEKSSRLGSRVKVDGSIEVGGGNAGGPPSEVEDIMEAAWLTAGLR